MNTTFWDKRIPTLLGIILIVIGVGLTTFLVGSQTNLFTRAAPPQTPEGIRLTNITDNSFTLTYTTQASVIGSLSLNNTPGGQIFLDDRDQASGTPSFHTIHSITAHSLHPNTTYTFSINSGTTIYLNTGKQFSVTTGSMITSPPLEQNPIAGQVVSTPGSQKNEAIIYVTTAHGQTLSTLLKESGIYLIPLNTLQNTELTQYITLEQTTPIQMLIATNMQTSKILLLANNRNPVPAITLNNDYDFTINNTPLASSSALPVGFPSFALDNTVNATPQIQTPTKDQSFVDTQPIFRGQALPNSTVTIIIHSVEKISTNVTADKNGSWTYRPPQPLSPGTHTITISVKDPTGLIQTITRPFSILMSGTQVAEAATPSATLTPPTPTPTKTPTPTPIVKPTGILSPTIIDIPTITPLPLNQPTITVIGHISPTTSIGKTSLPPTGPENITIVGFMGVATTLVGIILFIATRASVL